MQKSVSFTHTINNMSEHIKTERTPFIKATKAEYLGIKLTRDVQNLYYTIHYVRKCFKLVKDTK